MKTDKTKKLTMSALFAALICVATAVFAFPLPGNGFANLGDCFVILCGALLTGWWGAAAAAVGAALADCLLGYWVYAPATLVIKGLMALCVWLLLKKGGKAAFWRVAAAAVTAELVMVGGYAVFEWALYGAAVALADIAGNAVQGAIGALSATAVYGVIAEVPMLRRFFAN